MKYMLFFTGVASTPNTVGLKCLTTNEIICRIDVAKPSGKDTRIAYQKYMGILKKKYENLLN